MSAPLGCLPHRRLPVNFGCSASSSRSEAPKAAVDFSPRNHPPRAFVAEPRLTGNLAQLSRNAPTPCAVDPAPGIGAAAEAVRVKCEGGRDLIFHAAPNWSAMAGFAAA